MAYISQLIIKAILLKLRIKAESTGGPDTAKAILIAAKRINGPRSVKKVLLKVLF